MKSKAITKIYAKTRQVVFCLFLLAFSTTALFSQVQTAKAGDYNTGSTWVGGQVPPSGSDVIIAHSVTVSATTPVAGSVSVVTNGSLTVNLSGVVSVTNAVSLNGGSLVNSGGTLTIGATNGDNKKLTLSSGTINIAGGKTAVNGSVNLVAGTFTMSSGELVIDPNGGSSTNSVTSGADILAVSSSVTTQVTGGKITFVDPPYAGTGRTIAYTGSARNASWLGNTIVFGGSTTNASTSTNGFNVDTRATGSAGSYLVLGDVTANGGTGANRFVSGSVVASNGFDVGGNLLVNTGSQVRTVAGGAVLRIAGNLTNNGTFYDMAGISFSTRTGAVTKQQYITNNYKGTFRNSNTRPTGHFSNLEFNNTTPGIAIKFNFGDGVKIDGAIFVTGKVNFINGIVDIGTDNQFIFTVNATAARVNGALLRGIGPGGGAQMVKQYPAGASSFTYFMVDNIGNYDYTPATVTFSANDYAGRALSIGLFDKVHAQLKVGGTPTDYLSRYWRVVNTPIGTCTATLSFTYLAEDIVGSESNMQLNRWDGTTWSKKTSQLARYTMVMSATEKTLTGGTLAEVTGRNVPVVAAARSAAIATSVVEEPKVSIYPNPVVKGSNLNVQITGTANLGKVNLTVYNTGGQQVTSKILNTDESTSNVVALPSGMAAGVYTVLLTNNKGFSKQQKIVITE